MKQETKIRNYSDNPGTDEDIDSESGMNKLRNYLRMIYRKRVWCYRSTEDIIEDAACLIHWVYGCTYRANYFGLQGNCMSGRWKNVLKKGHRQFSFASAFEISFEIDIMAILRCVQRIKKLRTRHRDIEI